MGHGAVRHPPCSGSVMLFQTFYAAYGLLAAGRYPMGGAGRKAADYRELYETAWGLLADKPWLQAIIPGVSSSPSAVVALAVLLCTPEGGVY